MLKNSVKIIATLVGLGFLGYGAYLIDFSEFNSADAILCLLLCGIVIRACE